MSKTPQKSRSVREHLEGEIKKLKSEVRRLRKENRQLKKKEHIFERVIDEVGDHVEQEEKETCKKCSKGEIEVFDFVHVLIKTCNLCGAQRKQKKRN